MIVSGNTECRTSLCKKFCRTFTLFNSVVRSTACTYIENTECLMECNGFFNIFIGSPPKAFAFF